MCFLAISTKIYFEGVKFFMVYKDSEPFYYVDTRMSESDSEMGSTNGSSSDDDGNHKRRAQKSKVPSHVSGKSTFFLFQMCQCF